MEKKICRGLSLLLALVLSLGLAAGAQAAGGKQYYELVLEDTTEYLTALVTDPKLGSVGGDWVVLGLARCGAQVPEGFYQRYYSDVVKVL